MSLELNSVLLVPIVDLLPSPNLPSSTNAAKVHVQGKCGTQRGLDAILSGRSNTPLLSPSSCARKRTGTDPRRPTGNQEACGDVRKIFFLSLPEPPSLPPSQIAYSINYPHAMAGEKRFNWALTLIH